MVMVVLGSHNFQMVTKNTTLFRLYASDSYNKIYQRNIFVKTNETFYI